MTRQQHDPDDLGDVPPWDQGAEQIVLGAMMLAPAVIADVTATAGPDDFYRGGHAIVFETILALESEGAPCDPVAVADRLSDLGQLGKAGGAPYLHTLIASVPTAANAGYYAGIVRERAEQRACIETGQQLIQAGWSPGLDPGEKIDLAARALETLTGRVRGQRGVLLAEALPPALDRIEQGPPPGVIGSPWPDLDALTGGVRAGQVVVVAARPAVGKTTVLSNWASAAARAGTGVLYYTLEVPKADFTVQLLAAEASVDLTAIRDGAVVSEADWARLSGALEALADAPMRITDAGLLRTTDIRSDLRRPAKDGVPAGLVVIDYVQLMTGVRRTESKQAEVSEITGALKKIAKDHGVGIIVGAQLNRGPEMRSDHRPLLADLRDSGSLEQDSDIVILLYRPGMYDETAGDDMDLIVAKNRPGRPGTVTTRFRGRFARVDAIEWTHEAALDKIPKGLPTYGLDD